MLFPIFGSEEEPGYLISTPVKFGVKINSLSQVTAKLGVSVNGVHTLSAKSSVKVRQQNLTYSIQAVTVGSLNTVNAKQSVFIRSGEGMVILADIYPESFEAAGVGGIGIVTGGDTYPVQFIRPRLTIDGVELPLVDFTLERPEGRLGGMLNAKLAIFEISGLEIFMNVNFGYMIYNPITQTEHYVPRMTDGKLMGFELNIAFQEQGQRRGPADSVTVSAVDVIADRFNLRPILPVTMYDPSKSSATEVTQFDSDGALRTLNGSLVRPTFISRPGLGSGDALYEAYVYGLGFSQVVSNIPNYPITRADFGIEDGWHSGALPLFAMYGPLFFDSFNTLFILNITWPLPAGFAPRVIHNADYQRLNVIKPVKDYTNTVILTYKATAAEVMAQEGIFATYRFEQETWRHGELGQRGYQRIETTRKIKEVRRVTDPLRIITEFEEQSKSFTYAAVTAGRSDSGEWVYAEGSDIPKLVHAEEQNNIYDGNGLKTSHKKTTEAAILSWASGNLMLVPVLEETVEIEWNATEDPNVMVQNRTTTRIRGLVASAQASRELQNADGSTTTVSSVYPVVVAQYNGIAVQDTIGGVTDAFVDIRTITETLRHTKGNQLDVEVQDFDLLSGTMRWSHAQPRTGTPLTSLYAAKVRHIILEDLESIRLIGPRIPAGVNAGELPTGRAINLGWDVLRYIQNPRYDAQVILSGIDLSIDKGSVIVPRKRDEDASYFIVTGTAEHGEPKGSGYQIIMTLKGQEVNNVS